VNSLNNNLQYYISDIRDTRKEYNSTIENKVLLNDNSKFTKEVYTYFFIHANWNRRHKKMAL
jgi:hypothetical protein